MKCSGMLIAAALYCGFAIAADDASCDDQCLEAKGAPVPTHRESPTYPEAAADKDVEGCVVVSFVITSKGQADQYQVLDSQPKGVFDSATLKALNGWKFKVPAKPGRYAQRIDYRVAAKEKACDRCAEKPKVTKPLQCMETPSYDALNATKAK